MLVQVQVLALDRRFVLRALQPCWCWCWIGVLFGRLWCRAGAGAGAGSGSALPRMTSCRARGDIMMASCQGWRDVVPGVRSCHGRDEIMFSEG